VGIGTASPAVKLDVNGITGWGGGTTGQTGQIVGASSGINGGGNFRVLSNTTQAVDVGGALTLGGYYTSTTASVDFGAILGSKENSTGGNTAGYLAFGTRPNAGNMTERMRIDSSGNVGIGTGAITQLFGNYTQLGIKGGTTTAGGTLQFATSAGTITTNIVSDTNATYIAATGSSGGMAFAVGGSGTGTERMRIDSSGQLLVGLTSQVVGANIQATTTGSSSNIFVRNTTATTGYFLWGNANGADKLFCAQTGSITNATGTYGTISDAKLKENIVDSSPKLDKVLQLQVRNFNFIGDELKQIGFIAQEIEQVFPSLVEEHIGRDEEGKENGDVTKAVKTSILLPILVKAIQEQQALITQLQADVAALKGAA
jgi:hypothetical protein